MFNEKNQAWNELRSVKTWGWEIAVYLFLGGMGGGCYFTGILFDLFSSSHSLVSRVGIFLGPPIVLIGTFFLLADLGRPNKAVRAFFRPCTSWISRGSFILLFFVILGAVHIAFWIWPFEWLAVDVSLRKILEAINGLFALMTILYTGLLLGAFRPVPIWCNPLLPAIFLTSGLSTGLMATGVGATLWNLIVSSTGHSSLAVLTWFDMPLILLEGLMVFFYMQGSHLLEASRASTHKILWGNLATTFWIGFVLIGLVVPFLMGVIEQVSFPGRMEILPRLPIFMAIPGLVGGYLLRYLIIVAGIKVPLNVGGIMVPLGFEADYPG